MLLSPMFTAIASIGSSVVSRPQKWWWAGPKTTRMRARYWCVCMSYPLLAVSRIWDVNGAMRDDIFMLKWMDWRVWLRNVVLLLLVHARAACIISYTFQFQSKWVEESAVEKNHTHFAYKLMPEKCLAFYLTILWLVSLWPTDYLTCELWVEVDRLTLTDTER